jgi:hypothetical protein
MNGKFNATLHNEPLGDSSLKHFLTFLEATLFQYRLFLLSLRKMSRNVQSL